MAIRTTRVDDMTPDVEATQTVVFALGPQGYEIDLGDANVEKLNKALAPFVKAARPVPLRDLPRKALNGNSHTEVDPSVVRAWAQAKGISVADKGRVSEEIVNQWRAAMQAAAASADTK